MSTSGGHLVFSAESCINSFTTGDGSDMMQKPRLESNRSMYDCTGCPLNRKACATVAQEPVICNEESCNRPRS